MDWATKARSIAIGYSQVIYHNKKYGLTRKDFNEGKSIKVFAEELGGHDFISFNCYFTQQENILKPCEMSENIVIHFLENFV